MQLKKNELIYSLVHSGPKQGLNKEKWKKKQEQIGNLNKKELLN